VLRNDLKKSWKGPAFAISGELISMAIDNQTTIARGHRFTRTVSHQPIALRVFYLNSAFFAHGPKANVIKTHKHVR